MESVSSNLSPVRWLFIRSSMPWRNSSWNISAYSPEYGRSNGGTVMVLGKSGSNLFHGTLFEFFRNEDLNARNYFAQPGRRPEFRRNQYGLTVGGPISKNKFFFFADWQGTRLRTGITRQSVVPTSAQRSGVFATAIYDPTSSPRTPFTNNTIPTFRFDPLAAQVLQHYPSPNASAANNFILTGVEPDNQDQFDGRLDHVFTDKHRAFVRYSSLRDNDTPVPFLPDGSGNLTSGVTGHAIEYEALQMKLEKRFSRGLTFTFAYTFSKLIDDASTYFSQTIFTGPTLTTIGAADAFNRKLERDVSSGDIPRVFSGGWVYRIPRWWKISGWEIGGIVRVQAGDAVPVTQATNTLSAFGYAVQRPNRTGNPNEFATRSASQWFDKSAFSPAGQFSIGNSSRNPVRGPGLQGADLMISNMFRLSERLNVEFRAEVFNVSNTPPLNDPNGSFGSAAFGTITSAGNPRDFEFACKVRF